jgi:hypothetical protein
MMAPIAFGQPVLWEGTEKVEKDGVVAVPRVQQSLKESLVWRLRHLHPVCRCDEFYMSLPLSDCSSAQCVRDTAPLAPDFFITHWAARRFEGRLHLAVIVNFVPDPPPSCEIESP